MDTTTLSKRKALPKDHIDWWWFWLQTAFMAVVFGIVVFAFILLNGQENTNNQIIQSYLNELTCFKVILPAWNINVSYNIQKQLLNNCVADFAYKPA